LVPIFNEQQDWFSGHIPKWDTMIQFVRRPDTRVLEIGSWERRSAVYLLSKLVTDHEDSELVCIDHFDLLQSSAGKQRYSTIKQNLALVRAHNWRIVCDFSVNALMGLSKEEASRKSHQQGFDWIYIDGSHESDDTLLDAELAWRLARMNAIFIFDDYTWDREPVDSIHHPRRGIDAFLSLHHGQYEILHSSYQVILRKLVPMRLGFNPVSSISSIQDVNIVMEYSINIAITVDDTYAMPTAVCLQSLFDHNRSRMTVYILDLGLTAGSKTCIDEIAAKYSQVTMCYLSLPNESLAEQYGPTWAKIDLIGVVPTERVLYLDVDTLVRRDLQHLWDTSLSGNKLAAAPDVGFPFGPKGLGNPR